MESYTNKFLRENIEQFRCITAPSEDRSWNLRKPHVVEEQRYLLITAQSIKITPGYSQNLAANSILALLFTNCYHFDLQSVVQVLSICASKSVCESSYNQVARKWDQWRRARGPRR